MLRASLLAAVMSSALIGAAIAQADCEAVLTDAATRLEPEWLAFPTLSHSYFYAASSQVALGLQCEDGVKPVAYVQVPRGAPQDETDAAMAGLSDALLGVNLNASDFRRCIRRVKSDSEADVWLGVGNVGVGSVACGKDKYSEFFRFFMPDGSP